MYKKAFELMLKSMKNYIDSAKRLYDSIPDKEMFKYSYDEIMEYEVVVKEYSKYDRDSGQIPHQRHRLYAWYG